MTTFYRALFGFLLFPFVNFIIFDFLLLLFLFNLISFIVIYFYSLLWGYFWFVFIFIVLFLFFFSTGSSALCDNMAWACYYLIWFALRPSCHPFASSWSWSVFTFPISDYVLVVSGLFLKWVPSFQSLQPLGVQGHWKFMYFLTTPPRLVHLLPFRMKISQLVMKKIYLMLNLEWCAN